jgi:hypothetical protein
MRSGRGTACGCAQATIPRVAAAHGVSFATFVPLHAVVSPARRRRGRRARRIRANMRVARAGRRHAGRDSREEASRIQCYGITCLPGRASVAGGLPGCVKVCPHGGRLAIASLSLPCGGCERAANAVRMRCECGANAVRTRRGPRVTQPRRAWDRPLSCMPRDGTAISPDTRFGCERAVWCAERVGSRP